MLFKYLIGFLELGTVAGGAAAISISLTKTQTQVSEKNTLPEKKLEENQEASVPIVTLEQEKVEEEAEEELAAALR